MQPSNYSQTTQPNFPPIQQQSVRIYQKPMAGDPGFPPVLNPVQEVMRTRSGRQENWNPFQSGLQKLNEHAGIFVKQKLELSELVVGCESQNKYHVHAIDENGIKKGPQIFKAKENSNWCSRYCLNGDCRPFKMSIYTTIHSEEDDAYEPFLMVERPCTCTCLCLNRPELRITLVEGGKTEYMGKIVDPFNCCNMQLDAYDKDNQLRYTIKGSCCQLGVWCKCPCEPCQTIDFDVYSTTGQVAASLQKKSPGCMKAAVTDLDSFALTFPKDSTPADKTLLMCAVLFLDYRHFETNPNQNR